MKEKDLKYELKQTVELWIDRTFNILHIEVIKRTLVVDNIELYEQIEPLNPDYDDFFMNYNKDEEYKEWCNENGYTLSDSDAEEVKEEFCNQDNDFESYKDNKEQNNFPMWNYCYEHKNSTWEKLSEIAMDNGCGIINESDYFSDIIFMMSAGHSFFSAYFCPIYLDLFPDEAKKYKDINYQDL